MLDRVEAYLAAVQDELCAAVESWDGRARFREDRWEHAGGGGGATRVLAGGAVFERAGVNRSSVGGTLTRRLAARLGVEPCPFRAAGVSVVLHPESPMVPTVHMNVRRIELAPTAPGKPARGWFGGGLDLTPYYLFEDDAAAFHAVLRGVCEAHPVGDYERFKRWCDEYFFLPHRGETRGVGGIFFDGLDDEPEATFAFVRDVGRALVDAYGPIVERRRGLGWTDRERRWQLLRRGRYVEFNLVHDRGTVFGLETRGRTESILVSMPPLVAWEYEHRPAPGSAEAALLEVLRRPRSWSLPG